jgi:hypothetical protein
MRKFASLGSGLDGFTVRHLASLGLASMAVASGACAFVACSGGSDHEASDSGSEGTGRPDASRPDAATDAHTKETGLLDGGCAVGSSGEFIELRCAGLYSDFATKTVAPNNKPYIPGLQLWSDGAQKNRWIDLPPGGKIDTSDMDEWTFPVGTKFWKEFNLPIGSSTTPTRIETRLLWKTAPDTWYRTTYRWSADGETSATELTAGEQDANGNGYEVPDQFECNTCHNGREDGVLGFEAVGLSVPGSSLVTIGTLTSDGLLTAPPAAPFVVPGDAIQSAALGWLHVNCGTACHNDGSGEAHSTGFFTRLDVATLTSVETTDTYTTGWNVPATAYEVPDASTTYRLRACDVAESAAYYRAAHRNGVDGTMYGTQMPPIDTHKVDEAGIAELAAWMNEGCDGGADAGTPDGSKTD